MKKLRLLILVHPDLVPPEQFRDDEIVNAPWKMEFDVSVTLESMGHEVEILGVLDELRPVREKVAEFEPDVVVNLLEGFDEVRQLDAHMVSYIELLGVPQTGCNARGLMLSRDKALSKKLLAYHRIPCPRFRVYPRRRALRKAGRLRYPLIVKALDQDSSAGISQASVVANEEALFERVRFVHEHLGAAAIAEEFVAGRELYVGVLGNWRLKAFPVWELHMAERPPSGRLIATERVKFNDRYQKKYGIRWGPATDLDPASTERLQRMAKRAFRALELSGYARIDFRLDAAGVPHVIEANANPDIGYGSEFAESAHVAGVPYEKLLARILSLGQRWAEEHR